MPPRYSHGCPTISAIMSKALSNSNPAPCTARIASYITLNHDCHMRTLGLTIVALQDYRRRCYSCPHSRSPPLPFDRVQAGAPRYLQSWLAFAEHATHVAAKRHQRSHCRCTACSCNPPSGPRARQRGLPCEDMSHLSCYHA
jgi:hypothetical protein